MNLEVVPIKKSELSLLMQDEAVKEGWSYSQEDVEFYFHYPQNHIYAVKVDQNLVGCVIFHSSLCKVDGHPLISAGFFLVLDHYRGKKIVGPYLWEHAITKNIKNDAVVCFHSVSRAVHFYERLDFIRTGLVNNYSALEGEKLNSDCLKPSQVLFQQGKLKRLDKSEFPAIDIYNNDLFPGSSGIGYRNLITEWMKRPDAIIIAYYQQNMIQGFGVMTICKRSTDKISYRISPLYANSPEIAQAILKGLIITIAKTNIHHIELYTSATDDSEFGSTLQEIGFEGKAKNYVVCNKPDLIHEKISILANVFCSLPFEYPHEVMAG